MIQYSRILLLAESLNCIFDDCGAEDTTLVQLLTMCQKAYHNIVLPQPAIYVLSSQY